MFSMLNNVDTNLGKLRRMGLGLDEAKVYLELLRKPSTHLRLSTVTGVNRTKVYRIIDSLSKRSLVTKRTDDRGSFLIASDPATLEVELVTQEEKLKQKRVLLGQLLPTLKAFTENNKRAFVVHTYEGVEGLKQMSWHDLKTKGELLSLGGHTLEELIADHRWAEKHRALTVEAGYTIRGIVNHNADLADFTNNQEFMKRYTCRKIPTEAIFFNEEILIYNDTVAIYHWRENQKVGIEIVSETYANTMRQMFEYFWKISEEVKK